MDEIILKEQNIEDMIYEIRGKQVMLDSDLAKLYHVETKRINEAVSRNKNKFPERFSWVLNDRETKILRSQIATSSLNNYGGNRYNSRVFTEQGVAMLATILKSNIAVQVSINIMDAFVSMRKYISNNLIEQQYINNKVLEHDESIKLLQESFFKLEEKTKVNSIFFKGQIFDAYYAFMEICKESKHEIIIIDDYAGHELLNLIKDISSRIILISNNIDEEAIKKYRKQYDNIEIINSDLFHDRFIVIDRKEIYHSGASFKDLGKKCFAINKIEDVLLINKLNEEIAKII